MQILNLMDLLQVLQYFHCYAKNLASPLVHVAGSARQTKTNRKLTGKKQTFPQIQKFTLRFTLQSQNGEVDIRLKVRNKVLVRQY